MSDGTTTPPGAVATDRLRDAVNELQLTVDHIHHRLAEDSFVPPALAQDPHGRYILMDALTALVNGYAALEARR